MTKRYWVTVTFDIREYDEQAHRVKSSGISYNPASQLTPEPVEYIREVVLDHAEKLAAAFQDEVEAAPLNTTNKE